MKDNKVILINGKQSEWFEQAIFILRTPYRTPEKNLVNEAEKIIYNYMQLKNGGATAKKKTLWGAPNQCLIVDEADKTISPGYLKGNRKKDYTSLMLNIFLVICSVLLGFLLHSILR